MSRLTLTPSDPATTRRPPRFGIISGRHELRNLVFINGTPFSAKDMAGNVRIHVDLPRGCERGPQAPVSLRQLAVADADAWRLLLSLTYFWYHPSPPRETSRRRQGVGNCSQSSRLWCVLVVNGSIRQPPVWVVLNILTSFLHCEPAFRYNSNMVRSEKDSRMLTERGLPGKPPTATYQTRVRNYSGLGREAGDAALSAYAELYGRCSASCSPRWRRDCRQHHSRMST